ncbi:hypothetical protein NQ317_014259 [Molorchus minor]|uniref:P97 cofactor p47 n=1 Tax=Molorchus minor TaxID=1323400 RepID=A0ABQ9JFA6_9CUCU|nr:hypothetical protein NQ317_014259 [Molorchus minor]
MSDLTEKLTQFIAVTGASEDRARFFLDSAADQLEVAIARYYENEVQDEDPVIVSDELIPEEVPISKLQTNKPKPKSKSSNVATLDNLATSSDEEEGQAYYAGGSEHSGQQVLGSPKKRNIVDDMFKSVHEHWVEIREPSSSSTSAFKGKGYKLGEDNNDTEVIPGLWQNGFSINDGELRSYTDPSNRAFLESVRRGEIPQELRQELHGATEIHLTMVDHRSEAYKPSQNKKPVKPFQGHGYTLGSPAPVVVGAPTQEDKPANEARAKDLVKLDSSKPVTNLQIRLADGTRLVVQFNHEHTIGEVRSYILAARPQYQTQPFNLLSTYPSKVLDDTQTLQAAGLLNAAIMQKLI